MPPQEKEVETQEVPMPEDGKILSPGDFPTITKARRTIFITSEQWERIFGEKKDA